MIFISGGYEGIYIGLCEKLKTCDFAEAANRLELVSTKGSGISIVFLNQPYLISADGVNTVDNTLVNVNNRSVLAYYVLSKGHGDLDNALQPLFKLTGSTVTGFSSKEPWITEPLRRAINDRYDNFTVAALELGGIYEGCTSSSGHSWLFHILPKVPIWIHFYEADAEFPVEIQVLFDTSAPRFMEFECLAFLSGCFIAAMTDAATNSPLK